MVTNTSEGVTASAVMSPRQRWLAALQLRPVDPFRGMSIEAIHTWIGSDRHTGVPAVTREVRKSTSVKTQTEDGRQTTVFRAGHGRTELVSLWDEPSHAWHPVRHPVRTLDDVRILTECYADCLVELDEEKLALARRRVEEVGEDAVTCSGIGKSPLMDWVEWLAGVETAHYLLQDETDAVEDLLDSLHGALLQKVRIMCEHCPADLLYMVENTSTTLISPDQYRRYSFGHVRDYAEIARHRRRFMALHMCGHLKALLPELARLPVAAFEAFTSSPVGDTSLLDGRSACPDTCLIGGTDATLWIRPAGEIIRRIEQSLDALPHHRGIVVTSAGVMPPLCKPETIKAVCEWLKSYPIRL